MKTRFNQMKNNEFSLFTQYISENYIGRSLLMNPTGSPKLLRGVTTGSPHLLRGIPAEILAILLTGFHVKLIVCQYFCFAFFTEMKVCDDLCKMYI